MATADMPAPSMAIVCPLCKRKRPTLLIVAHPRAVTACATCAVGLVMNEGTPAMGPIKVRILQMVQRQFKRFQV